MSKARAEQIEQITYILVENLKYDIAGDYTEAYAQQQNEAGWTFETTNRELDSIGHVMRHEGVVLSPTEFSRAWADANRIVDENNHED